MLVVDCDPQGNASRGLGQSGSAPNLYDVIVGEAKAEDQIIAQKPAGQNFDVMLTKKPWLS